MSTWSRLLHTHGYRSPFTGGVCIGIPTINRKDLLTELLDSLATHKDIIDLKKIIIIDNGNQNISEIVPQQIDDITAVHTEPSNLGVAGSWNKIMDLSFRDQKAQYTLLLNDDIVIGERFLNQYNKALEKNAEAFVINGPYYWSAVTVTRNCFDTIGIFDTEFFPAYFEDNDYATRISLYGESSGIGGENLYVIDHDLAPEVQRNSQTVSKDGSLNSNFGKNGAYFNRKWGGSPHQENLYKSPFNDNRSEPWKLK